MRKTSSRRASRRRRASHSGDTFWQHLLRRPLLLLTPLAFAAGYFSHDSLWGNGVEKEHTRPLAKHSTKPAHLQEEPLPGENEPPTRAVKKTAAATPKASAKPKQAGEDATPSPAAAECSAPVKRLAARLAETPWKQRRQTPAKDEWADAAAMEKRLSATILAKLGEINQSSVSAFISEPENRLLLAQWQLVHAENTFDRTPFEQKQEWTLKQQERWQREIDWLGQLCDSAPPLERRSLEHQRARLGKRRDFLVVDENSPITLREALADPVCLALFRKLTADADWMEQFVFSGDFRAPGRAIAILSEIARDYPEAQQEGMPRAIATATALEAAKYRWGVGQAVERADFYIESNAAGRLHPGFRKLPFRHLRIVCGSKVPDFNQNYMFSPFKVYEFELSGSAESLRWAQDNVHLPADWYTGACWQAEYREENFFGDSVHTTFYYAPYGDEYEENTLQRVRDVGGVCGQLSHFGAYTALAHGIPAITMYEPEHIGYALMLNGKWVKSYSVSWEHHLEWRHWPELRRISSLHMADELYDEEHKRKACLTHAWRTLGNIHKAGNKDDTALDCLRAAVRTQPANYPAWLDYAELVRTRFPHQARVWEQLNEDICRLLAPRYPEVAADLLESRVYPHMNALPDKQIADTLALFWKKLKDMGPERWEVEHFCEAQLNVLKKRLGIAQNAPAPAACIKLYEHTLNLTLSKPAYTPIVLAWGSGLAKGLDEPMQKKLRRATINALKRGSRNTDRTEDESFRKLLVQILLEAEKMRDLASFRTLCSLFPKRERVEPLPEWKPFPGKLVSQGGLLAISSTCSYDTPALHGDALKPVGGKFHTDHQKDAWALVMLPRPAYISGVVTVSTPGNMHRLAGMKVQYSESGRDDDWHEAGAMPDPTGQRVNRLDLRSNRPRARYFRIRRPGGPECFHLFGIYVYGRPAA